MNNSKALRSVFFLAFLLISAVSSLGYAASSTPTKSSMGYSEAAPLIQYSDDIFRASQASGKHIVLDVWKEGCPTCKAQYPIIEEARKLYPDAVFMKISFSTQKKVVTKFKVLKQSTIIVFKGTKETGRMLGETNRAKLLKLIATGA